MLTVVRNLVWTGISQLVLVSLILDQNEPSTHHAWRHLHEATSKSQSSWKYAAL